MSMYVFFQKYCPTLDGTCTMLIMDTHWIRGNELTNCFFFKSPNRSFINLALRRIAQKQQPHQIYPIVFQYTWHSPSPILVYIGLYLYIQGLYFNRSNTVGNCAMYLLPWWRAIQLGKNDEEFHVDGWCLGCFCEFLSFQAALKKVFLQSFWSITC